MNEDHVVVKRRQKELLARIEAGIHDDTVSLSSLLRRCILLGPLPGAEELRDWARQELDGYVGREDLPLYRHIAAPLMAVLTDRSGRSWATQRIENSVFPKKVYEILAEKVDLEDATLGDGLGTLEALAQQDVDEYEHKVVPYWASFIRDTLEKFNSGQNIRVAAVYWSVPGASLHGLLVQVRTALAERIAELRALMPQDEEPETASPLVPRRPSAVSQDESGRSSAIAEFGIHHDVIARMMKEIQDSFDQHPIRVPVNADGPTPGTTINYNGPVIKGDANGARLAWGNRDVDQSRTDTQQIAPGFEPVAQAVARTLEQLSVAGLSDLDREDAEEAAKEVLAEVTQSEPNQGKIRRALAALKHLLAPVAAGAVAGAGAGAQEWARTAIEHLQLPL